MDDLLTATDELCSTINECLRNGIVGANGYDEDGYPIGGGLSIAAMGEMNGAAWDFAEITGLGYTDAYVQLVRAARGERSCQ